MLGVLVTISSVGAGALGVTALLLLYPELPVVKIAGSDIAHAVPLTLVAGMGHLMSGGIDIGVLVSLLLRFAARHRAGQPVRTAPARSGAAYRSGCDPDRRGRAAAQCLISARPQACHRGHGSGC